MSSLQNINFTYHLDNMGAMATNFILAFNNTPNTGKNSTLITILYRYIEDVLFKMLLLIIVVVCMSKLL